MKNPSECHLIALQPPVLPRRTVKYDSLGAFRLPRNASSKAMICCVCDQGGDRGR